MFKTYQDWNLRELTFLLSDWAQVSIGKADSAVATRITKHKFQISNKSNEFEIDYYQVQMDRYLGNIKCYSFNGRLSSLMEEPKQWKQPKMLLNWTLKNVRLPIANITLKDQLKCYNVTRN
jgi:hypothetical protein